MASMKVGRLALISGVAKPHLITVILGRHQKLLWSWVTNSLKCCQLNKVVDIGLDKTESLLLKRK